MKTSDFPINPDELEEAMDILEAIDDEESPEIVEDEIEVELEFLENEIPYDSVEEKAETLLEELSQDEIEICLDEDE